MEEMNSGTMMCRRFELLAKARIPSVRTETGMLISRSPVFWKEKSSIASMDEGSPMVDKAEHPSNMLEVILETEAGRDIRDSFDAPLNNEDPMMDTEEGTASEDSDEQFEKAKCLMMRRLVGRSTSDKERQPLKAESPME